MCKCEKVAENPFALFLTHNTYIHNQLNSVRGASKCVFFSLRIKKKEFSVNTETIEIQGRVPTTKHVHFGESDVSAIYTHTVSNKIYRFISLSVKNSVTLDE